jgi:hypothetical protein
MFITHTRFSDIINLTREMFLKSGSGSVYPLDIFTTQLVFFNL